MSVSTRYDAIVIGAGVLGCATGFELARRGLRTLNVDKLHAAGYGSTAASCAIVRFHYSTLDGAALARESYYHWLAWPRYLGVVDAVGMARYRNTGCLVIKTEKNRHLATVMANLDALGIAYEELAPEDLPELVPGLDPRRYGPPVTRDDERFGQPTGGRLAGAVYLPETGFITDPQLAAHNLQVAAEALGGEFLFGAEVAAVPRRGGRVAGVRLADGRELAAPVVINVAGPHSAAINRLAGVEAGMRIGTRALKHEVCHVPAPPGVDFERLGPFISDGDSGAYVRPDTANHLLLGSEDPECDERHWVDDPDDYETAFTEQWTTQVLRAAQRLTALPVPTRARGVVGLYDVSDDWLPIYDRSDLAGFYLAIGTSGNQFKNAPVVGRLMAELVTRVEAGHDHDRDPLSLRLPFTRHELDLGVFSRRREIHRESSFSVIG